MGAGNRWAGHDKLDTDELDVCMYDDVYDVYVPTLYLYMLDIGEMGMN